MLNYFFQTCYYLAPFLLSFFGIAGALVLFVEPVIVGGRRHG